ncbi:hypothetical protein ACE41H_15485 [Paenibacillus enshidis]|uniref:Uncharacterized protein n=1 Tax=Paenibacillus enshidis TaxID=1458439 RepID=A0ABV5AVC5_9BACL
MMNFEITFAGVASWFQSEGLPHDDNSILRALLLSEELPEDVQEQFFHLLIDRYENINFQSHRNFDEGVADHYCDVTKPLHQLSLRFLKDRELHGLDEALINLGLELAQDKQREAPFYESIHAFFGQGESNG